LAVIKPFKGIRYNRKKITDLSKIITPPYDVIDDKSLDAYYSRHPNNIIRLEYGKKYPSDSEKNNRYTRASADFTRWLEEEILVRDKQPALYFYEQEFKQKFTFNENQKNKSMIRRGFVAAVKLEEYDKGIILPHEDTIPGHKADRLALMHACKANFSPIFGLYDDPEGEVVKLFKEAVEISGTVNNVAIGNNRATANSTDKGADICITDEWGQLHRLWIITDTEIIKKVQKLMQDKRIYIADGHHRYETALNYRNEQQRQQKKKINASESNPMYEYSP